MERRGLIRVAGASVLLAVVYFVTARAGLTLASVGRSVTLVWPPTGVAIGVLLVHGKRLWPGVALGAFAVNVATPGVPVLVAAGIAAGNTGEALVATWPPERAG